MNCNEVRELLAAYALDAVSESERAAVREHLTGCALHPELTELRATVEALAGIADEVDAPANLRARVLALATGVPDARAPAPVPLETRRRRLALGPWALAAVIAALALGLAWWDSTREDGPRALVTRTATAIAGPALGRLTYDEESRELAFEVESLPPPAPGMTYQLWVVRGSTPVSLGTFSPGADGHGELTVEAVLGTGETLAVTVEPAGGSPAPTSQPFLAITL